LAGTKKKYQHEGIMRMLLAIFTDALSTAFSEDTDPEMQEARADARAWLLEEGAKWAQGLGYPIFQRDIKAWAAAGWPKPKPGSESTSNISKILAGTINGFYSDVMHAAKAARRYQLTNKRGKNGQFQYGRNSTSFGE
jgi:hypothetical protein